MIRYLVMFVWLELIVVFALGCSSPRERRGDWMEHLNYKQFNFDAPMIHWDRHNYYSHGELREIWKQKYELIVKEFEASKQGIK